MAQVGYAGPDKRGRKNSGPSINGKAYMSYQKMALTINEVGLKDLRQYVENKPWPVRNFDRDIRVIACVLKYGPQYAAGKFNMLDSQAGDILRKYYRYALECRKIMQENEVGKRIDNGSGRFIVVEDI